jgi:hypothetical protein
MILTEATKRKRRYMVDFHAWFPHWYGYLAALSWTSDNLWGGIAALKVADP